MARTGTAVPEYHDSSDLAVYRPEAGELVPYTDRGFSEPTEAAVAWWMAPGFIANTSDFRAYERANGSAQASYPEEYRVFFTFVQAGLDDAEQQSVLRDNLVLYRGIGPGLAGSILATGEYREPAFASTSYDIALSLDAFGPRSPDGYRTVLVLGRGIGQHALYVNEDEREFLIPRDTRWQLTRALDVGNLTVTGNFALHGQTGTTARYDHVRLLYMTEETCT